MDVLHERRELGHRVRRGRERIVMEAPREDRDRGLLLQLEDAVADLHAARERVVLELRAEPDEVVLVQFVLAIGFLVGEVAPLAVVGTLHAELGLEDRAVLQVSLEHFLEERGEACVFGRRLRGGGRFLGKGWRRGEGHHHEAAGRGQSAKERGHSNLLVESGAHASGWRRPAQPRLSRHWCFSSQSG